MDLNTLFAKGDAVIELKHPVTGELLLDDKDAPMTLTVIGTHTKAYKTLARKIGFDVRKRNNTKDIENMTFDEFESAVNDNESSAMELMVGSITNCNIFMGGASMKFSKSNIEKLLSDEGFSWIAEQYSEEVDKGEAFFEA